MKSKFFFIILLALILQSCNKSLYNKTETPKVQSSQFSFTEGPASDRFGNVYFTDQPNNKIFVWSAENGKISEFMDNTGRANGTYFDKDNDLITCSDEKGQLWKISEDKKANILLNGFNGKRFNGPNDLWIHKSGGIYFTDPLYMRDYWKNFKQEIPTRNLYFLSPDGVVSQLDAFQQPNGIIGSNRFHKLYVSDFGAGKTYVYDISKDAKLTNRKIFCEMGSDGMTMDHRGNVYLTGDGVTIFNPNGIKIGHIPIPEKWTANVTFGGKDFKTLFITASKSIYTLKMNVKKGK